MRQGTIIENIKSMSTSTGIGLLPVVLIDTLQLSMKGNEWIKQISISKIIG